MTNSLTFDRADLALLASECSRSKSRATRSAAERISTALEGDVPASEPLQLHVDDVLTLTGTCQYSLKRTAREAAERINEIITALKDRVKIDPAASTVARMRH